MKLLRIGSAALLLFALTSCESFEDIGDLDVPNESAPDRTRALADAGDIESLIGGSFLSWWQATQASWERGDWGSPAVAISTAADEFTMSWGNYGAQHISSEPRVAWDNSSSFRFRFTTEEPWYGNYRVLSAAFDGLKAMQDPDIATAFGDDFARAQVFAKFMQGMAHGWLAMFYDSAFVFNETVNLETDTLALSAYPAVWAEAQQNFADALTLATGEDFTTPTTWIRERSVSTARLVQLIHSQLARWMPQVARTPAERDAVNWAAVVSHVDAGVTTEFDIESDGFGNWYSGMLYHGHNSAVAFWSRADYKTVGHLEVGTGQGMDTWLATPVSQRKEFLLNVPDRRIHGAAGGSDPGLDFDDRGPSLFREVRGTYHYSRYAAHRYEDYPNSGAFGPMLYMHPTEGQLTKAEGLLRLNGPNQTSVDIINATRTTRGQLPAVAVGNGMTVLMDAVIYEKRIENYGVCSGCAFFDRRGWGPLISTNQFGYGHVEGTQLHFAVPGKELEVLQKPIYTYGGVGKEGGALPAPSAGGAFSATRVPAVRLYAFDGLNTTAAKLEYLRIGREYSKTLPTGALIALTRY